MEEYQFNRSDYENSDIDYDLSLHGNLLTLLPTSPHDISASPQQHASHSENINIDNSASSSHIPSPINNSLLNELIILKDRLIEEKEKLDAREKDLQLRESKVLNMVDTLTVHYENLRKPITTDKAPTEELVLSEISANEDEFRREIFELRAALKEKNQENERLTNSFRSVRQANDAFKQEIAQLKVNFESTLLHL